MTKNAGIWIDHKKALIVIPSGEKDATTLVEASVEKRVRYSGGARPGASHMSREGAGEDTRERRFEGQLAKYYDEVITYVRDADAIWIFGPGEAKVELKTRLEHGGLGARVQGVDAADKMTDRQIAAKVRKHFAV